ncbi:MAG: alpha/beta hydrolase [Gemmatimonadaceae bacterium]
MIPTPKIAALAALLLAAPAAAQGAAGLRFPPLAAGAKAGTGAVAPCAVAGGRGRARCGVFRVFEDREARSGRTIDIRFVVFQALDSARRAGDAVLYFMGGPGVGTIEGALFVARESEGLRRTRDILLVDLRGVGLSDALDCDLPYPGGFRSRFGVVFPLDHVARCRDALAKRARLDRYTTASTVDDLEELRRWLGYASVDLIGGSYGTRVVQTYLRRHPRAVRVAVMNGVTPIDKPGYVDAARYLQRALDLYVAECEADAACAHAYPRFRSQLAAVRARFRAGPRDVEVAGTTVRLSSGDVGYALRGLLYSRARDIPRFVERAAAGDYALLAGYYESRTSWIGEPGGGVGNHFSVLCAEDIAPVTDADVRRATANTFLGDHLIRGYRDVCRIWPAARLPAAHFKPVASDVPTLLLSGGRDPVTPPSGAEHVARALSHSLHVVVPDAGHGVGGPCVDAMIVRLVEDGTLDRVDAGCVK